MYAIKKFFDNKQVINIMKNGKLHGYTKVVSNSGSQLFKFNEGKLIGKHVIDGFEFDNETLLFNSNRYKPEKKDSVLIYNLYTEGLLVKLDIESLEVNQEKIKKHMWNPQHVYDFKVIEKDGYRVTYDSLGKIIRVEVDGWKYLCYHGSCPELKKKFSIVDNRLVIEHEDKPSSRIYGTYDLWVNIIDNKISMINCEERGYSMRQAMYNKRDNDWDGTYFFQVHDNRLRYLVKHDGKYKILPDGTCKETNERFTLDINNYTIGKEDL